MADLINGTKPVEVTEANFQSFVEQDGIAVLDWWAEWCGPCRAFAPVFEGAASRNPSIRFGKVNTDEQRGLGSAFEIQSIPTLMVFRDRVLLYSEAGALPASAFDELLKQVQAVDMAEVHREIAARAAQAGPAGEKPEA
jgi:thioredoxin 1